MLTLNFNKKISSQTMKAGLRANMRQFLLLVLINAFVGGMFGLERSVLPPLAKSNFHLTQNTAILLFILLFGLSKSIANFFAGKIAYEKGRKTSLVLGWLFGLPVPLMLMFANSWILIILANVFLGINQGLAWSSTVMMKIDIAGKKNRGLAMGLNEFAGYVSVAGITYLTSWLADKYQLGSYSFIVGIFIAVIGLLLSLVFTKETRILALSEEKQQTSTAKLSSVFRSKNLFSITQAGFFTNLNDGMIWGLLPLLLLSEGFSLQQIGTIAATYTAVWGIFQSGTGYLSDLLGRKPLLVAGMFLQGIALLALVLASSFNAYVLIASLAGFGTALVYPTFGAAIADYSPEKDSSKFIGSFRFWRDFGYVAGALFTGLVSDYFGFQPAVLSVAVLTLLSSFFVWFKLR